MKFCVTLLVLIFALQIHAGPIEDFKLRLIDISNKVLERTDFVIKQMQIKREPKVSQMLLRVKGSEIKILLKHLEVARGEVEVKCAMSLLLQAVSELADRVEHYLTNNKHRLIFPNLL